MKTIPLTHGKVALVDDSDYELLMLFKWHAYRSFNTFYAKTNITLPDGRKTIGRMHRMILGLPHGDKQQIDHRDNDGLNNQRYNLRLATNRQNARNCRVHCNNSTGFKGVRPHRNKFMARIVTPKKHVYLGLFKTPRDAAVAYNEAALVHFGEFAKLNEL